MGRTSFGVVGLDASARFGAAPPVLSGFVVLLLLGPDCYPPCGSD